MRGDGVAFQVGWNILTATDTRNHTSFPDYANFTALAWLSEDSMIVPESLKRSWIQTYFRIVSVREGRHRSNWRQKEYEQ